jgi:hypothetical protein
MTYALLSEGGSNAKTAKHPEGLLAAILYMTPDERTCPMAARNGCLNPCLAFQGRTKMFASIGRARTRRRELYFDDPVGFTHTLSDDLLRHERRAVKRGLRPVVRLDGTSDLGLAMKLHLRHPGVLFYDYTKVLPRVKRYVRWRMLGGAANYHLTFSLGADNADEAAEALEYGVNVAVPFALKRGEPMIEEYRMGGVWYRVIDGDVDDWRWRDPQGVIVGLRAKGDSASLDEAGFIQRV